jgi:hypothetical protein
MSIISAPELDAAFERLYAYVQDDVRHTYATPHLAITLLCASPYETQSALASLLLLSPLRRYRLVTLEATGLPAGALGSRMLRIDERLAHYARGINWTDERVESISSPPGLVLVAPQMRELGGHIASLMVEEQGEAHWHIIHLVGQREAGRLGVAAAICEALGLTLRVLNVSHLPHASAERLELLHVIAREAILSRLLFYCDLDVFAPEERQGMLDDFASLGMWAIIASAEARHRGRGVLTVSVPAPDPAAQVWLWRRSLSACGGDVDAGMIGAIVEQFHFGPDAVVYTVEAARQIAALRSSDPGSQVGADDLWHACRVQSGRELDELARRIVPCHDWSDIVLPDDAYRQLEEIAVQVAQRAHVYETWGFGAKLNRGRGVAALFSGPSGTGKTMAAEILANHLRLDLFRVDLAAVVSKYIGETEKNLQRVFDAAERSGAVLFFDEADALFARRSEVKDSHDRYANMEVNYLLQRMEDYRGLAILATNMKSLIDEAFLRRLRFIVDFPFPDAHQRYRIWQTVFPLQAPVDALDFAALARLEIPGGNIRNIVLNAAFQAAGEGTPISMDHVMHAARREYKKIDKLMLASEFGPYYVEIRR